MLRNKIVNLVISFALGVLFLWLSLRGVEFHDFARVLKDLRWDWFGLFLVSQLIIHWFRVMRIRILLRPVKEVSLANTFISGSVGCLALMVLPLRLGDLVRPYLLRQLEKITMKAALGAVAVERVIDGVVVTAILFITLAMLDAGIAVDPVVQRMAYLGATIFIGGLAFLVVAYVQRELAARMIRATAGRVSPALGEKLVDFVGGFTEGLRALPDAGLVSWYMAQTVVYWSVNALGYSALMIACGIDTPAIVLAGFMVLALSVYGVMIPGPPAAVGPYEFFVILAVGLFAAGETGKEAGLAVATVSHVVLVIIQVAIGGIFFFTGHVSPGTLSFSSGGPGTAAPGGNNGSG